MLIKNLIDDILHILTPKERKAWRYVMVAVAANSLLDFFGIASLLPLLYYLMTDRDSQSAAVIFGGLAIAFILVKGVAGIRLQRYRSHFLMRIYQRLSLSLYKDSFNRGILYIRTHGVGRIGHEITWVCHSFCNNLVGNLTKMAGDLFLLVLLGGVVVAVSPMSALILALPLLAVTWIYRIILGDRMEKAGKHELESRRAQARIVNDTFGGFPDVVVARAGDLFEKDLKFSLRTISDNRLRLELYGASVMPMCEIAVAMSLAIMAFIGPGSDAKMALGLFAVAAFRIIPAIRGLVAGEVMLKNASASMDVMGRIINGNSNSGNIDPEVSIAQQLSPLPMEESLSMKSKLEIKDITFSFPGESRATVSRFSCVIERGEYVGFKGESGVGKSTMFNIILGIISPNSGEILVDGICLNSSNRDSWLSSVGYVPQEVYVFNRSVVENVALGFYNPDRDKIIAVLREVRLNSWLQSLPNGIDTILGERGETLSGGERQRLGLARALFRDVSVLMLDEATSALDNDTESDILSVIDNARMSRSLTVMSISHRDSSLSRCTRIINI